MVTGTKNNIKSYLDECPKDEPLLLLVGRNPQAFYVVKALKNRCIHSGRCTDGEIAEITDIANKFEHYPNKQESLLFPNTMVNKSTDHTSKPTEKTENSKNPVIDKFEESRLEVNQITDDEPKSDEQGEPDKEYNVDDIIDEMK